MHPLKRFTLVICCCRRCFVQISVSYIQNICLIIKYFSLTSTPRRIPVTPCLQILPSFLITLITIDQKSLIIFLFFIFLNIFLALKLQQHEFPNKIFSDYERIFKPSLCTIVIVTTCGSAELHNKYRRFHRDTPDVDGSTEMVKLAQDCAIQIIQNESLRECSHGDGKRYGSNIAVLPFISRRSHLGDLLSEW